MSSGSAGAYAAEIDALQNYQKQILNTLDGLTAASAALTISEAVSSAFSGVGTNNGLGTFPEAVELSGTYNSVMQTMMTNFREISDLVTAMANALGKSAQNYVETEQQITDSFNQIVQKYENQNGSFSPTATAPVTTSGQVGTSSSYYTATAGTTPATTTTQTSTTTSSPAPSGSGSIAQGNDSNASNDTSSEE